MNNAHAAARVPWLSRKSGVLLVLGALALGAVAYAAIHLPGTSPPAVSRVTIALPTQINSAPLIVATAQGLFRKAGVEVTAQPFLLGKDALQSVLDGKADLAVVADTPFMFALLRGSDIAMLAGISQSRRSLAVVARSDRDINSVKDLAGKSIALTMGTNFTYFLDALLQVNGVPTDSPMLLDMKVDAAIDAFKAGRTDAAVVFQPYLARLQAEMGDRMKVFFGEDVYAFRFLLVGKPSYIDGHPGEIQRILRALIAANRSIHDNPAQARTDVGMAVKIDDAAMSKLFDPEDYAITLDDAMLLALEDQTRWAMKRGLVQSGPVPNYLNAIRFHDLDATMPAAVRMAH